MPELLAPVDLRDTPDVASFLDALRPHTDRALAFVYDGRRIRPGYHLTEVKVARYDALDCGANPETWTEVVLQLWDVDGEPTMSAGKFVAIYEKAAARLPAAASAPVVFECGPRDAAAGRYTAATVGLDGDALVVTLDALPASCKPQDRWQAAERARTGALPVAPCC